MVIYVWLKITGINFTVFEYIPTLKTQESEIFFPKYNKQEYSYYINIKTSQRRIYVNINIMVRNSSTHVNCRKYVLVNGILK